VTIAAGPGTAQTTPVLRKLRLVPAAFPIVAPARSSAGPAGPGGTRIRFKLSQAARVTFTVHRRGGRRVKVGAFAREAKAGANSLKWGGTVGKKALTPGRYRLTARARTGNGPWSKPRRKRFSILNG
jgi:hypothetical protein